MTDNRDDTIIKQTSKVFLIILDGYGLRYEVDGNAVKLADTPHLDKFFPDPPQGTLCASGRDVGLPSGLMGNSEVGHLNLGAGRIVFQDIARIDRAIRTGEFFRNQHLLDSIAHAKSKKTNWHLIGLVSDGGVHSSLSHLYALLKLAKEHNLSKVYLHALMDGRDTPPHSGVEFIWEVGVRMREIGVGRIASICGRYWTMDRDRRWDRVERGYRLLTDGEGLSFESPIEAVADSYRREVTDEFIEPSVMLESGKPIATISEGDAVMFFNFRADRTREITFALTDPGFDQFKRTKLDLHYTTMTQYHAELALPVVFPPIKMENILGEVIDKAGLKQFRTAETEKYAHVTFFFNGGDEAPFKNEHRLLILSPQIPTYDLKPEMSASEVARHTLDEMKNDYPFMLLNFANPDMVGHTGNLEAAIKALESLDPLVDDLIEEAKQAGYTVIITADHGNCEMMHEKDGSPHTAHTTNRVPLAVIRPDGSRPLLRQDGILADVAPTILEALGLEQPSEMTGKSLIT